MKKILIILDGAADLPITSLAGKTPLEAAKMPNLNYLARKGKMGYMYPINEKTVPGSDNSLISIFGNIPTLSKRGILEAVAENFKLKRGDLALRTNLGTIDNIKSRIIIDRRAGRTLTTKEAKILAKSINEKVRLPYPFSFKSTIQHRGILVIKGGFSDNITDTDTEWILPGKKLIKFRFSEPLDEDEISKHTVNILNEFISQSFAILENHPINLKRKKKGLLPANIILTRGAGIEIPDLKKYSTWMSINYMPIEIGISKVSGMDVFSFEYPELKSIDVYKNLYEGLNKAVKFAVKTIKKQHKHYNGCYIQFKETDVPGHDNKPLEKIKMLELIDKKFFSFIKKFAEKNSIMLVVTCDHSTPCKLKSHSSDSVPVLVYGKDSDNSFRFTESQAKKGKLGKIYGKDFMKKTGLI